MVDAVSQTPGQILPDGMALRSDGAIWNPRPAADYAISSRKAYHAGYSDGFHGARFGEGDEDAHGAFSTYRVGFADGREDDRATGTSS